MIIKFKYKIKRKFLFMSKYVLFSLDLKNINWIRREKVLEINEIIRLLLLILSYDI